MATIVVNIDSSASEKDIKNLVSQFEKLDKSSQRAIKSANKSFKLMSNSIDMAVSGVKSLIGSAASISLSIAQDFLDTNIQLERFEVLMKGVTGSLERGRQAMDYVLDFASKAPFSIDALSDTFVRFKVAGLDPMYGSMMSLTDAIGAFGGTSEDLKLATMALQQMQSKGVVSMEELRRQLSERIPTAIHDMAKGLDMTYAELVEKISSGAQSSGEAIGAMMKVWNDKYAGAAAKLMDTMSGAISRFKIEWDRLLYDIGKGNGAFSSMTDVVKAAADALHNFRNSAKGAEIIESISNKIVDMVDNFSDPSKIEAFFTTIVDKADAALLPVSKIYEAMVWMTASVDQLGGGIDKASLSNAGVDIDNIDSSNYAEVRDILFEIQKIYDEFQTVRLDNLFSGGPSVAKEVEDQVRQLAYQANNIILNVDSTKAESKVKTLEDKIEDVKIKVGANVDKAKEEIDKLRGHVESNPLDITNEAAFASMREFKNAIGTISEAYKQTSDEIAEQNKIIAGAQRDLADELRGIAQEGMTEPDAYNDTIKQIEEYRAKAAEAFKAKDMESYVSLLERAKELTSGLDTGGASVTITQADVDKAKKLLDWQAHITSNGWAPDNGVFDRLTREYSDMKVAMEKGESEVISSRDQINTKYRLTKEIGEELLKVQEQERDKSIKSKEEQIKQFDAYVKKMEEAAEKTQLIETASDDVALAWVKVGDTWLTTTQDMVEENDKLITSIQNAITEMNYLKSLGTGSSSSSGTKIDGELATGGPVIRGRNYIVGDGGEPEIFTPGASGFVTPQSKAQGSTESVNINLSFPTGNKVSMQGSRASARALMSELQKLQGALS